MPEQHTLRFHLPGILTLLGEHLYSNPRVAVRELIQNAYDSCQRRRLEDPQLPSGYHPSLEISADPLARTLTFRDNGSGLTRNEIATYLSTIGRSYTTELAGRLASGQSPEANTLVGQFGLGLLSAFAIASRIEILTHSYKMGQPAWRWVFDGGEHYTLDIDERPATGTTVILHLKLEGEFLLNATLRRETVRQFANFLPISITFAGESEVVNQQQAPWDKNLTDLTAYADFVSQAFDDPDILTLLVLRGFSPEPATTATELRPLRGVLYVPADAEISVREYGDVWVYVRRMFVTRLERDLLPPWARFVRGVIEAPHLNLTASREQVRKDAAFYETQKAVEQQLLAHFRYLAEHQPQIWKSIVYEHNDLIKGWAVQTPQLFNVVSDLVYLETTEGQQTLPQYLANDSDNRVFYLAENIGETQAALLYEAKGLVAVKASRFAEEDFLKEYAAAHPEIELVQLTPGSDIIFEPANSDDRQTWLPIMRYFTEQGVDVQLVSFDPILIPMVLVFTPGSDTISRARRALEQDEIHGAVARMLNEYVSLRDPYALASRGVLHLNTRNSLLHRLLKITQDDPRFTAVLEILYHNARFFAGQSLTASEARLSFDMITFSVADLLQLE